MSQRKRLIVDMDGVLADVYQQFFKYEKEQFQLTINPDDCAGVPEEQVFPHLSEYIHNDSFFLDAPLMEGSKEVFEKLNKQYDLYIVSAAMEFPNSLRQKLAWLQNHFPFIKWQQIVFCGSKEVIKGDIMIDDHFKNLDYFDGKTYLFAQPHSIHKDAGRHERVQSWSEIAQALLA
ncbi:5' nucleotidase, NT5C type [Sphingobacterium hungaricum]|uniref:5'(3')-deoxyribonucleotidase n=1 Tax=Sphingobacterium hungaricum TaxID=2082723 RepID=A0A928YP30_9SPHI|nr:5'(3')-deoxyribonucleotidase [Sphingobacterium hungaricum]MBE8712499.1 5'(3')-deoxyribonucleotidase [Sphingobacterium hungaricum]